VDDLEGKKIEAFAKGNGKEPFTEWFDKLKNKRAKAKIFLRIRRARRCNYGYHRRLGFDFLELKERMEGGIRVYIGEDGDKLIILLLGGNKSSQSKDIALAQEYWKQYKLNKEDKDL
jgi:putative addiction module killer protein